MQRSMVRSVALWSGLGMLVGLGACAPGEIEDLDGPGDQEQESVDELAPLAPQALTGNGAPNGAHFTLNIIGVPKGKTASTSGGSRMFVPLSGSTKINLSEGEFAVLDGNATDGSGSFQLPSPDPDRDGTTTYSVFARALGKPGGSAKTTTCAQDATGETFCSVFTAVAVRESGRTRFTNVSRELLFIFADVDGDGTVERHALFSDALQNFYWQFDNSGLKLLQLRFYEVPTTVSAP